MAAPLVPIALALAQYAPQLMRYFGAGEASTAVAEKVVGVAQAITGTETPQQALERMRDDAAAQFQFRARMLELDAELERDYLADRQDARRRDVALAQLGQRIYRADVMVALDAVGLVACLVVLAFYRQNLPPEAVTLISTIAGIFGLCLRDAHQYEFGSSRGSAMKSQEQSATMAALVGKGKVGQ